MLSRDELKNIDIPELETLQQQIIAKIGNEEGKGESSKSESELQKYSKMIKGVIIQKGTVDKQKERHAENKKKEELLQTTSLRGGWLAISWTCPVQKVGAPSSGNYSSDSSRTHAANYKRR